MVFQEKAGILVVGSAHLDIFADFHLGDSKLKDKIGSIKIFVGGTAFNIAYNLGVHGNKVLLASALNPDAFSAKIIEQNLKRVGVGTKCLIKDKALSESAFVALRRDGELVSAVTDASIEKTVLEDSYLRRCIERAKIVVLDCNLSPAQLNSATRICGDFDRPLFIAGVSDSKIIRVRSLECPATVKLIAANEKEITTLTESTVEQIRECAKTVLERLNTEFIVMTRGKHGYSVIGREIGVLDYSSPTVSGIQSSTGSGDALLAAVVDYFAKNSRLDWNEINVRINRYVYETLQTLNSVPGSTEIYTINTNENKSSLLVREIGWNEVLQYSGIIATIIGAIAAVIALVI